MTPLSDLTPGRYRPGDSPVHRLDPRVKLGACALAAAAAFVPGSFWGGGGAWPFLLAGIGAARLPLGPLARGVRPFGWLLALTVALHGLTEPGRVLLAVPGSGGGFTAEGLARGAGVAAQLATAVGLSVLLAATTSPADLVWGLERLGSPLARLGVPVADFCTTLLLALRCFPLLHQEAGASLGTWRAGGRGRLGELPTLVAPLLRRVWERAEALAGEPPPAPSAPFRPLGAPDFAALTLAALTLGAALGGRWGATP